MRDIVLVTVDSLRADHIGWHGYERNTTPHLDRFADSARTFSNAFAHACSTRPSFPAILTSSYPLMYGGYERLSEKRSTIGEVLSEEGYSTGGYHSNLYLASDFGYDAGFDQFFDSKSDPSVLAKLRQTIKTHLDDEGKIYSTLQYLFNATEKRTGIELGSAYVDAAEITDRALSWAKEETSGPRFLWVHYMDVHHPYVPPAEYQKQFRDKPISDRDAVQLRRKMLESPEEITENELNSLIDLYDAEIAYVDNEVNRLVETLKEEWGDDLVFAFTADHGEEFLDHGGFSHSATFYDEVLHVPLLIDDGSEGTSHDELVGLLDLSPTLAQYANADPAENFYGESLDQIDNDWDRSQVVAEWANFETGDRRFGIRTTEWKYIREEDDTEHLYDVSTDPEENENLVREEPEELDILRACLEDHIEQLEDTTDELGDVNMDEEVKQRLRDLGYQE